MNEYNIYILNNEFSLATKEFLITKHNDINCYYGIILFLNLKKTKHNNYVIKFRKNKLKMSMLTHRGTILL